MANYKPKACKYCGAKFKPTSSRAVYCSTECRKVTKSKSDREYRQKNSDTIRKRKRERYEANRNAILKQQGEYRQANKEAVRERKRKYAREHRDAIREYNRNYWQKNAAHLNMRQREYYQTNKEMFAKLRRKWRANNPGAVSATIARRACAELEGNATSELIEAKWEASDKTCILCGKPIDNTVPPRRPESRTIEHLTPIARGGRHDLDNISFAHWSCNSSKNNKTLEEYRAWQARLQQAS